MNKIALAAASGLAAAGMLLVPAAAAMAAPMPVTATQSQPVGAISGISATVYQHPKYGTVYKISGNVSGAAAGQQVQLLNANGTPAKGFTPFAFAGGNTFTLYYNPGAMAGSYVVKIGNQTSAPFYLNAL